MKSQAFAILEFDALRALVSRNAQTDQGRARILDLVPIADPAELLRTLDATEECLELRRRGVRWSFDGVSDSSESIARLRIEGTALEPLALLDLARICARVMDARSAIAAERDNCPTLFATVASLPAELSKLAPRVTRKILPNGELDDRASPELARIRRELARLRANITRSLENLMRRASDAIQDALVTVRNDRFVIPVRADHRTRISGVAHGVSSSGATVFVEPLETIEANNELQTLRETEEREIANILFDLSEELRRELPAIEQAAGAITELDLAGAKAAFAETLKCVVPTIGEGAANELDLVDARHPLLEENLRATGSEVVPVSFKLDAEHPTMVISGANAGGKTVVLKTAGLLSLMALSGLPVPARLARVPFYRSVLADIGDHQSLAANLSTFTSHAGNIASMIEHCEPPALVLLDEVGTGTDPEEGSALGVAVVDHFKQRSAHVLATTHYAGLKMYAANEPGVLNASVEFDEETLQPTYRLLVGIAGSSSGLEIARRFGIPNPVINNAAAHVKESSRDAIEYLRRTKREAEDATSLRLALEEERAAVAETFAGLEKQAAQREQTRQMSFEKELQKSVAEFEQLSRDMIAKIEDRAARIKLEKETAARATELKRAAQDAAKAARQSAKTAGAAHADLPAPLRGVRVVRDGQVVSDGGRDPRSAATSKAEPAEVSATMNDREIRVGDRVRLSSFGSIGIVDQVRGHEAEVRVGSLRMREQLENLELLEAKPGSSPTVREGAKSTGKLEKLAQKARTTEVHLHSNQSAGSTAELNLVGNRTDEAVDMIDKFLDQAFLNGVTEVRIIHGHGTGALRRAVKEFLEGHPHVARHSVASQEKGGAGATIVELIQ